MADNKLWTPDLSRGSGPLYLRLVDAMAEAIASGALAVGEQLPPQRQLAWRLNINLSTVTKAFHEATKRRLIAGEVGRGTYVLGQSAEATLFDLKPIPDQSVIDLSTHQPASPDDDRELDQTLAEMLREDGGLSSHLHYFSPHTIQKIRMTAAKWLHSYGYPVSPEHCLATSTAQHALMISLLAACDRDDTVLVDELTFPGMKAVAKQLGLKLHGVAMDEQGLRPEALVLALRTTGARVLVSDPTLQNPTGAIMDSQRRQQISELIVRHQLLFIEEYVIGSLSGIPPLSSDIRQHSILITGFAKSISPGVRFAVIAGEHPVMATLQAEPYTTSWQLSPLIAEVACRWIQAGIADRRQQWQRQEIDRRFKLFRSIFPAAKYTGNQHTCSHLWLPVNDHPDAVAERCRRHGLEVVSASTFAVGRHYPNAIRVSLTAALDLRQLTIGLQRLKQLAVVCRQPD